MTESDRAAAMAAVRAAPAQAEGWYELGRLLARLGEADKARDCFTRAVALDPAAQGAPGRRPLPSALPPWFEE